MRGRVLAALVGALAGCVEFPALPPCADDQACGAGQVCVEGACRPGARPDAAPGDAGDDAAPPLDGAPQPDAGPLPDGGPTPDGALPDAGPAPDATVDAGPRPDAGPTPDAARDAGPPTDGAPPPVDAAPRIDAAPPADATPRIDATPDATPAPDAAPTCAPDAVDRPCAAGVGACARGGLTRCAEDGVTVTCDAVAGAPAEERCNGEDDDCDGAADEDFPLDEPCLAVGDDGCRPGRVVCGAAGQTACAPDAEPSERCDGFDNDCDALVDEDFDLQADADHCGACGQACPAPPHGLAVCEAAGCALDRCDPGFVDADPEVAGCELALAPGVLHVDDDSVAEAPDGTEQRPYRTVQAALAVAARGHRIAIAAGRYTGPFEVTRDHVELRGASVRSTTLVGTLTLSGDGVAVTALTLEAPGQAVGVRVTGDAARLEGVTVQNVGPATGSATGVALEDGDGHVLRRNTVRRVTGGRGGVDGCATGSGGDAIGVDLRGANGVRLVENEIGTLEGGLGGGGGGQCTRANGSPGGDVWGVRVGGSGHLLFRNAISGLEGGAGGEGTAYGNGGAGGRVAGLLLEGRDSRLVGNALGGLAGGVPGVGGDPPAPGDPSGRRGVPGSAVGVRFAVASLDPAAAAFANVVDDTNTVEGEPVVYRFGAPDAVVEGYALDAAVSPTNLGKIVLVGSPRAVVRGNQVSRFVGETGPTEREQPASHPGGLGAGVTLVGCDDATVEGNVIADVRGGVAGGTSLANQGVTLSGGPGGPAQGVLVVGSARVEVLDNDVRDIVGGPGGPGGVFGAPGGQGGRARGVALVDSPAARLIGNTLAGLAGGPGGEGGQGRDPQAADRVLLGPRGAPGVAFGLELDEASLDADVALDNTVDDDPIVYRYGAQGETLRGLRLVGPVPGTNLGRAVILGGVGVTLEDLYLGPFTAGAGATGRLVVEAVPFGEPAVGVLAVDVRDLVVRDVVVEGLVGGAGGPGAVASRGGGGGPAQGLVLTRCPGALVEDVVVHGLRGGAGTSGADALVPLPPPQTGPDGQALGVSLYESPGTRIRRVRLTDIRSTRSRATAVSIADTMRDPAPVEVRNLTVADVWGGNRGDGVSLDGTAQGAVVDTIFARMNGQPVLYARPVPFEYCTFWDIDQIPQLIDTTSQSVDPMFVVDAEGDPYALDPRSPAVDAGDPASPCEGEPPGTGSCRVDQGHLGNTGRAHAR